MFGAKVTMKVRLRAAVVFSSTGVVALKVLAEHVGETEFTPEEERQVLRRIGKWPSPH
jgi:hypothetical protein